MVESDSIRKIAKKFGVDSKSSGIHGAINDLAEGIPFFVDENGNVRMNNSCLDLDWLPKAGMEYMSDECTIEKTGTFFPYAEGVNGWEIVKSMIGQKLTVYWDGERYDCTLTGNTLDGIGLGATESFPFSMSFIKTNFYVMYTDGGTHTMRLAYKAASRMPEDMLPESVGSVVLRSSTEGSTKKFRLTVDDSGAITATEITA